MANVFDINNYILDIPSQLTCGDFWGWKKPIGDYGVGYDLTYTLTPLMGGVIITIPSTIIDNFYVFTTSALTTAGYVATHYRYTETITQLSDNSRAVIKYGNITLLPDPTTVTTDIRSHARRVLDAIRATIEGRATNDQLSMSINGRSISRTPLSELLALELRYTQLVQREEKEESLRNGIGRTNRQILIRMG